MRREKRKFLRPLDLRKYQYDKLVLEGLYHSKHHESHWKRLQQKYNHNHYKYLTNIKVPPLGFCYFDPASWAFLYTYGLQLEFLQHLTCFINNYCLFYRWFWNSGWWIIENISIRSPKCLPTMKMNYYMEQQEVYSILKHCWLL